MRTKRNTVLVLCLNSETELDQSLKVFATDFEGLAYIACDGKKLPSDLDHVDMLVMQTTKTADGIVEALKKHTKTFTNGDENIQVHVCGTMGAVQMSSYAITIKNMLPSSEVIMYKQSCPDKETPTAKAGYVVCKTIGIELEDLYPIGAF